MERLGMKIWYLGIAWGLLLSIPIHATIQTEFNITSGSYVVNWFETEAELQAVLGDDLAGLAECEWRPDFNTSFCELWLVRPVDTDDEYNFDTIGHEFYHAVTGAFHDE